MALAFACIIITRRPWWEKGLLLAAVLPSALVANSTRIVITGLLYQAGASESLHQLFHDAAGLFMIPYAAVLFALVLWYLANLVREVELMDVGSVVRKSHR